MRIYLDTEFTDLNESSELLSQGAITECGERFYMERTPITENCSPFVRSEVLPHFSASAKICTLADIAECFVAWLATYQSPTLIVDSDWDIAIVSKSFSNQATCDIGTLPLLSKAGSVIVRFELVPTYEGVELVAFMETTWKLQSQPGFRRHHALDDAIALREAVLAAKEAR